jgi:hypothetical protein
MSEQVFDDLKQAFDAGGAEQLLAALSERLRAEKRYPELFDAMLLDARRRLGLPIVLTAPLDDLPEPLASQLEEVYLTACRTVGSLLLEDGELRSAWRYLRPVGDKSLVAAALERMTPDEENLETIIEIALHERVAPELGFRLLLENSGVCDAISTFEALLSGRPRRDRQGPAELLVRRVHADVVSALHTDIRRQEGTATDERSIPKLLEEREWLFLNNNYHLDTTHLAATVRFARALEAPEPLRLAIELTDYGRCLSAQFQYPGDPPFTDVYPSHALFFRALLGENVDEALDYFRQQAAEADGTSAPGDAYVELLARLGRYGEAVAASAKYLPSGTRHGGAAPTLLELSQLAGRYDELLAACKAKNDPVSFATGLMARGQPRK